LGAGFKRFGSNEALASGDAIRHLFKVYVEANAASFDPAFDAEARKTTELLEAGDEETIALWQKFRSLSAASYDKVYARLGIEFDVLYSESMYAKKAHEVAAALRKHGALTTESNGAEIVDFTAKKMGHAVIVKEDGGSVYLTRDIAAAADRKQTLDFDRMLYVAGATQDLHFKQLFHLLDDTLGYEWASSCSHVNFGNVQGMSTRQGSVVFLEDILDEARERMLEIIVRDPEKHARLDNPERTAEAVGLSAVVVQDLKTKRVKGYKFDWNRILKAEGDTGPFLQYTHARLFSISKLGGVAIDVNCSLDGLTEPVARDLVDLLSRYDETLDRSLATLEPAVLVQYLFQVARSASKAVAKLRVKDSPSNLAKPRMLLFERTREVLADGLTLLGLTPLDRI